MHYRMFKPSRKTIFYAVLCVVFLIHVYTGEAFSALPAVDQCIKFADAILGAWFGFWAIGSYIEDVLER